MISKGPTQIRKARQARIAECLSSLSTEENRRYALAYSLSVTARTYQHPPLDGVSPRAAEIIHGKIERAIRGG